MARSIQTLCSIVAIAAATTFSLAFGEEGRGRFLSDNHLKVSGDFGAEDTPPEDNAVIAELNGEPVTPHNRRVTDVKTLKQYALRVVSASEGQPPSIMAEIGYKRAGPAGRVAVYGEISDFFEHRDGGQVKIRNGRWHEILASGATIPYQCEPQYDESLIRVNATTYRPRRRSGHQWGGASTRVKLQGGEWQVHRRGETPEPYQTDPYDDERLMLVGVEGIEKNWRFSSSVGYMNSWGDQIIFYVQSARVRGFCFLKAQFPPTPECFAELECDRDYQDLGSELHYTACR